MTKVEGDGEGAEGLKEQTGEREEVGDDFQSVQICLQARS